MLLRVMWQQSQGVWGRVLCGLPRLYLSALKLRLAEVPRAGTFCQSEWPDFNGLDLPWGRSCCGLLKR